MFRNPFDQQEIQRRIALLRTRLQAADLEAAVIASPENVFYLTGLDHWGYFAPHLLIVSLSGMPVLVTRAMERVSIEKQVTAALFRGHSDSETAADVASKILGELRLINRRIGLEYWTSGLSHGLAYALKETIAAEWVDISGMVDTQRLVKSAVEQQFLRQAATISEAAA
ncbi:MAG TPA: aminopeptidase P family N-terminal domain-containing protein, partial [Anaerolineales bacterium]|nr:aminopeptidase P family N-terminal domain-containing protein [Anaerolineales bacterium]